MQRTGAALLFLLVAACSPSSGAFLCFSDEECSFASRHGTCQQTGYCSFEDGTCGSGQRYGAYAGDGLSSRCVPGAGEGGDGGLEPDAEPLPPCGSIGDDCCTMGRECIGQLVCTDGTCGCPSVGAPIAGAYAHHTCELQESGSAYCWGSNSQGQIGSGDTGNVHSGPIAVANLVNVSMIAPGGTHTCAISGGDVWCWGDNDAGQCGVNGGDRPVPKRTSVSGATFIATAGATTCAVAAGQVFCWGRNQFGQVGDGSMTDRKTPKLVPGLSDVVAVTAGVTFSCALKADATVWCWGDGSEGQLGNGGTASSLEPVPVAMTDAVQVVAGDDQACARTSTGLVYCWGDNEFGTIGDGTSERRTVPTQVVGLADVAEIDVADEFACARKNDGSVWCWGENDFGQLGRGNATGFEVLAQAVPGLDDVTAIAAGAEHACARRSIGAIVCWGSSADGQLGDESTTSHLEPTAVRLACMP